MAQASKKRLKPGEFVVYRGYPYFE